MRRWIVCVYVAGAVGFWQTLSPSAEPVQTAGGQRIDLAERLKSGKLRAVNREVSAVEGVSGAIHLSEAAGNGVVWIEGTDLAQGTIELDVRGRDVPQRSFVGVAFHRKDDTTYDAVYLRPFNFRNADTARRENAVQYISLPDYDWPRLRKEFPSEFENPVDASIVPTDWLALRVVVGQAAIQVYVGPAKTPTLEVRKLGSGVGGAIGLWAGNTSEGDYRNVRMTPAK